MEGAEAQAVVEEDDDDDEEETVTVVVISDWVPGSCSGFGWVDAMGWWSREEEERGSSRGVFATWLVLPLTFTWSSLLLLVQASPLRCE